MQQYTVLVPATCPKGADPKHQFYGRLVNDEARTTEKCPHCDAALVKAIVSGKKD